MNEKKLINSKESFNDFLSSCGLPSHIVEFAFKMDLNIPYLINEKIINNFDEKKLDEVTRNILGVYGNYIATSYCMSIFKDVENEVPILDSKGKVITRADISFIDNVGNKHYAEVKCANQIIDNIRNYVDSDLEKDYYEDKDNEIIKYKNIGKKLIEQLKKLSTTGCDTNVFIYKNCYVDGIIRKKIKELGATIIRINLDINELEDEIRNILIRIKSNSEKYDIKLNDKTKGI